jgi:hypothetical protein
MNAIRGDDDDDGGMRGEGEPGVKGVSNRSR